MRSLARAVLTNLKHLAISLPLLIVALVAFGVSIGADAHLFEGRLAYQLDGELHVFLEDGRWAAHTVRGDNTAGFAVDTTPLADDGGVGLRVVFPADSSAFTVRIAAGRALPIESPPARYDDGQPVLAVSDIESGFGAFREFLVVHGVADDSLNWTFGRGHLVLVGDFVDRGASTTQVLWAIYQLEQAARAAGGTLHFILGNHEIKSLQGNYQAANEKYFHIAGILGKQQHQLFDDASLLGRWMASKNVIEVINGVAYVHGGLAPGIAEDRYSVDEINRVVRLGYRRPYFAPVETSRESFLNSVNTGPAWYRGYFKDDLSQEEVERGLAAVGADAVVVGHTLQGRVNARFNNRVFAIDVKHPKDYLWSFPPRRSEGLLVEDGRFYRLRDDGKRRQLDSP